MSVARGKDSAKITETKLRYLWRTALAEIERRVPLQPLKGHGCCRTRNRVWDPDGGFSGFESHKKKLSD